MLLRISDTAVIPFLQPLQPGKAMLTGFAILLTVCVLLHFLITHSYDIQVRQAAKDISADYTALVDVLELLKLFLKYLNVSTKTVPTPPPNKIVVTIVVELLTILALATKKLMQGQLSAFTHPDLLPYFMQPSELHNEAFRRAGCRGNPTEALSARPVPRSDDRIADSQGDLRRRPAHEGCYEL
jgi:hypothetical protein